MEPLIIVIWTVGAVVATGGALTMMFVSRSKWRKLPSLDVETKGPGPSLDEQERAIAFFVTRWPEPFDVDGLKIEWRRGDWFWVGKQKAAGKTMNKDNIVCAKNPGVIVLFHELVHVFCWREHLDPDYHHFNQRLWDRMYEIQQEWKTGTEPDLNVSRWSDRK